MATEQIHPTTPSSTETDAHTLLEAGADPSLLQLKNHQNNNTNAPVELLAEVSEINNIRTIIIIELYLSICGEGVPTCGPLKPPIMPS